ncbi:hypothetical protein J6590_061347 [Homalodisca vitripennis]|nr:hypothetical protein J6590_061347 [Homalodisca vitripennis]
MAHWVRMYLWYNSRTKLVAKQSEWIEFPRRTPALGKIIGLYSPRKYSTSYATMPPRLAAAASTARARELLQGAATRAHLLYCTKALM